MRLSPALLLLAAAVSPLAAAAQAPAATAAPAKRSCIVQPAVTPTDADRAFAAGDSARAATLYRAEIAATPSARSYAGLVRSLLDQNLLTEAVDTANKAAAALPTSADAQALVGEALTRNGQIPEANAAFAKALTLDHCSAIAHLGVGRLNEFAARHATAARELAAAHALAPHDAQITAFYLPTLAPEPRIAALHTLLASEPTLTPAAVGRLNTSLAILEQHKTCTAAPITAPVNLNLLGVMLIGTKARSWGIKPRINNVDLAVMELDSSVAGIVLNPKDAKAANVHPLTNGPVPANGIYYAVADNIRIGAMEYHDCTVRVAPAAQLANANSLIGTDFFRDQRIHIDYVLKTVTLTPYPAASKPEIDRIVTADQSDWSSVYIVGSDILIPTWINKKGPYLFALDTGEPVSVISPDVNKRLLFATRSVADLNVKGISATFVKTFPVYGGGDPNHSLIFGPDGNPIRVDIPVKIATLRFFNNEFADNYSQSFDFSTKSHDSGIEIAGLLGLSVISEYFTDIDYRNGLAKMAYDPQHLYSIREILNRPN